MATDNRKTRLTQNTTIKVRLLHERIANQRKDFLHKESRRITNDWDAVCVRELDLQVASQTLKLGSVMDSGFGMFRLYLEYKLKKQGKAYIVVDKFIPTTKTCHHCGYIKDDLTLRDRVWVCPACGEVIQREVNAARNIRDAGLSQFNDLKIIA